MAAGHIFQNNRPAYFFQDGCQFFVYKWGPTWTRDMTSVYLRLAWKKIIFFKFSFKQLKKEEKKRRRPQKRKRAGTLNMLFFFYFAKCTWNLFALMCANRFAVWLIFSFWRIHFTQQRLQPLPPEAGDSPALRRIFPKIPPLPRSLPRLSLIFPPLPPAQVVLDNIWIMN